MKYLITIIVLIVIMGCSHNSKWPKEQSDSYSYIEDKGYKIISYEGRIQTYELTRQKIVEMPYMMYWGLQMVEPSVYFGETIVVEKFIVKNHPLALGKVELYVFVVDGQPIGGTSSRSSNTSDGGYWSLDGQTLEELQPKTFQEWREDWIRKYAN